MYESPEACEKLSKSPPLRWEKPGEKEKEKSGEKGKRARPTE